MTHRDRAGDASGQGAGRREAAGDAGHRQGFPTPPWAPAAGSPARPERRLPKAFGLPKLSDGRMASDVPHRHATRSWPKALGNRLYESLSALLGITSSPNYRVNRQSVSQHLSAARAGRCSQCRRGVLRFSPFRFDSPLREAANRPECFVSIGFLCHPCLVR